MEKVLATVFASEVRTATANSSDIYAPTQKGAMLLLNISAASGTSPTLDIKLQALDELSGTYIDMPGCAFAQKTTTGTDTFTVYPGLGETANRLESSALPRTWRAVATIGGTNPSFTFSVGAQLLI